MLRICHCEHPKLVYNRYIGRKVLVSCGKCAVCLAERRAKWVAKIIQESKCHKFTRVVHFTYNDDMIPRYDLVNDMLVEQQPRFHFGEFSSFCIRLKDFESIFANCEDYESEYFYSRLYNHRLGIPHVSVLDIQKFKKRLNSYIAREVTGCYGCFRSAIASEYGETTFRPHYHGVFFFDDSRIAENFERLVVKAWQDGCGRSLGTVRVECDRGYAASYISKYVTKSSDIPKCYSHPALSTFFLTSRNPPLGSLLESVEEDRKIFESRTLTRTTTKVVDGVAQIINVPLGQALENRLYPKVTLYSSLPAYVRTELYKSVITSKGLVSSFDEYLIRCYQQCHTIVFKENEGFYKRNHLDSSVDWLSWPSFRKDIDLCCILTPNLKNDFVRIMLKMTNDFTSLHFPRELYRCGCSVWHLSRIFDLSFDDYLLRIYDYYDRKEKARLNMFYQKQNAFLSERNDNDFRCLYPETFLDERAVGSDGVVSPNDCYSSACYLADMKEKEKSVFNSHLKSAYLDSLSETDKVLFNSIKINYYGKKCDENAKAFTDTWS